jgi:squalene synthase HpnC
MAQLSVMTELARYGPEAARRPRAVSRGEALAYCRELARSHYENFSVASLLLPRALRPHFYAIYAYCRWADDLADETREPQRSLMLLDWWQHQLERCYAGAAEHPVFVALGDTIQQYSIPPEPFLQLLSAFRQDQTVTHYATPAEVLDYCRRSANPVGRLILYLGRCHESRRAELADSICTGLQLANFCQDVARDAAAGRMYVSAETWQRHGYTEEMFNGGEFNPKFRAALEEEVDRAESCLRRGEPLVRLMPRTLQLQVALFVGGGLSILRAIRAADYDVWRARPTVSRLSQLALLGRCWWRTRGIARRES